MSTFGTWISPRHIEMAYVEHVSKWITTYIAEAERQFGIPPRSIPVPGAGQFTVHRSVFEKYPDDQTPAVLVLAPGLAGTPRREADRSLTAPVALAFGVIAAGGSTFEDQAAEIAQIIGLAIREIVRNLKPEGIEIDDIELLDEQYGDIEQRGMGSSRVIFRIWVKNWAPGRARPIDLADPPSDPYEPPGDWPLVTTHNVYLNLTRRID